MSYPLTLTSAAFNTSGKFGQSLNAGYGSAASQLFTAPPITIRALVKGTTAALEVAAGRASCAWIGKKADGTAYANFASPTDVFLTTSISIIDGAWHELELNVSTTGATFYVDGVLAASSTTVPSFANTAGFFSVRTLNNTSTVTGQGIGPWSGEIDQVAVFSAIQHTATYTPSTTAMTGSEAGLIALYALDGNGTDSAVSVGNYPMTMVSDTYDTASPFGQALNGGYGTRSTIFSTPPITLRAKVKGVSSSAIEVICGNSGKAWLGKRANNMAVANFSQSSTSDTFLESTVNITDGAWHELELNVSTTGATFYVDGVLQSTSVVAPGFVVNPNVTWGIRTFTINSVNGNGFGGEIDQVAVFNTVQHTAAYTPATTALTGTESGLIALYALDGNGYDSNKNVAATALTVSAATTATVGTAITVTIAANGFLTASKTVNLTATKGTFSPTSVTLPTSGTVTAQYTPTSAGAETLTATDSAASLTAATQAVTNSAASTTGTALTISAATTATVGTAITVTIGANGTLSATKTVNLTATKGTFSPTSVTVPTTGTVTATYTPTTVGADTLTATDSSGTLTAATQTVTNSAGAVAGFDQTKVRFSPYNWVVTSGLARSQNDGAYFRFAFSGATCTLGFDMTNAATPVPKLVYRVDGEGPWNIVDLAATIVLTMPTTTAAWAQHYVEVEIRQTSEAVARWTSPQCIVALNAMTFASGGAIGDLPPMRAKTAVCYGDSIFCGINALNASGDSTVRGCAQMSYMNLIMRRLGFDYGMVSFGGQGWLTTGSGSVPVFPTTWNYQWSGQARTFSEGYPDAVVICQSQNDNADVSAATTSTLNAMIALFPRTTKIVVLRALSGKNVTTMQAGIAAVTDPTRITYVDTTGWFNSAKSLDGVHPIGWEHNNNIARLGLEALRAIIQPVPGARTLKNISEILTSDGTTVRANLTGLKWSIFDQTTPDALTVPADSGNAASTDSSGVLAMSVYSTKAVGTQVFLTMTSSDGTLAFKGLVTLK